MNQHARACVSTPPSPLASPESGADFLMHQLCLHGVQTVFGYPGGAIMPVYDALRRYPIRHVLTRHEQSAAFAANAWGRVTGKPGVCLATSGPGATNLITGLADAFMDSVPMIAITGQVSTALMGTDAFQYVDIFGLTMPVVKHSLLIRSIDQLPEAIDQAFELSQSGRPGPVLIDLPKDIQQGPPPGPRLIRTGETPRHRIDPAHIQAACSLLRAARRPLMYVGGGVAIGRATAALRSFQAHHQLPQVVTLKGLGAPAPQTPGYLGMLGMHGSKAANTAVAECDLLICIGARFDDRATGVLSTFAPDARVIHMDIDAAEIGKLRPADCALRGNLIDVLDRIRLDDLPIAAWRQRCESLRQAEVQPHDAPGKDIYAPALLQRLSQRAPDAVICCDVGQHQMWVAQHCQFRHPRDHLTSGGLGAMGFGLPAGIGASLALPEREVIVVSGDGSIQMNIQELATLRRYDLPVKIILLDNSSLGLVRQWQQLFFEGQYSEVDLSDNPDFAVLARAFGIEAFAIRHRREVDAGLTRLLRHEGPCLMHVQIDPHTNVWPLVPPGKPNTDMLESAS